ncbi:MAG: LysR family transcriptional regulator [Aliishimia sp.]
MELPFHTADWSLVQSFLAVAETGSLSAAAESLHQSQPTLGRHIKSLETRLGIELFHRHARGLDLTELGAQVLPAAQAMRTAMNQIALTAEAHSGNLEGTVRIACSVYVSHYILPQIVAQIRCEEPAISIVVHASDDSDNLLFREADIALRMYRPKQLELVTRHIGDIEMGVFASKTYIQRKGQPVCKEDFADHDVVGYDQSTVILDEMAKMGLPARAEEFAVRCDNQTAYWELVRAGCGIGFSQLKTGLADPAVVHLDIGVEIPSLPIWLTAHEAVRRTPRVDRVWGILAQGLKGHIDPPRPTG